MTTETVELKHLRELHKTMGAIIELMEQSIPFTGKRWRDKHLEPIGGDLLLPYIIRAFRESEEPIMTCTQIFQAVQAMGIWTNNAKIHQILYRNKGNIFLFHSVRGFYCLVDALQRKLQPT